MANDKDFLLKNAVEVGGSTKTTLGTVTNDDIDLSTGNYFAHSPSGATTYTISNAGDVQSFQVEVTGGTDEVIQNFSTTTYGGTASAQTITNNIDLATDGGLVWTKWRSGALGSAPHVLVDTERGVDKVLKTNTTDAEVSWSSVDSFTTTGYTLSQNAGPQGGTNYSGGQYVSWAFKKAAGFFDVVTYTGDGTLGRQISHSLGVKPGFIIVKRTDTGNDPYNYWRTAHIEGSTLTAMDLNTTSDASTTPWILWSDYATTTSAYAAAQQTSTYFTVGSHASINGSGGSFVAYLFAHDTASDGLIQCGSYTGNGSTSGPSINLGWEPQWLLLKNATTGGNSWGIIDNQRGITGNEAYLFAQANWGEDNTVGNFIDTTSTGFDVKSSGSFLNGSGDTIIYIAIRNAADLDLTWPTSIEWAGGVTPAAPATGETDLFSISTDDGGTTYQGFKVADNLS